MKTRILYALFAAYVAATAVHIGYVMAHEPFAFDAWNVAVDTHSQPFSFGRWFDYWWFEYTHSNPRIGQSFAYLSYKLEYFAVIATPLAYLAISLAVTTLGLGRWPRRGRDLALWAIAIGFGWFAFPYIGRNMFNRAYGANYVYTLAIQLWFLVPLRLARSYDVKLPTAIAYGAIGIVAGICNEHTAPALLAFLVLYAWTVRREAVGVRIPLGAGKSTAAPPHRSSSRLVWAGAIGFAIGFAAIFFAPGQSERYDGLANKTSLPMRLVQRGVIGAIDIVGDYLQYAAPLLVVIALAIILIRKHDRESRAPDDEARDNDAIGLVVLAFVLGIVMAMTLWVSPKLGGRFYLMSMALLLAATLGLIDVAFERPKQLVPFVLIAVFASSFAAARTIPLYRRVFVESEARLAGLAATPPGGVFVADAFDQGAESWWYIGDDFDDPLKRERVASYMGLARVVFRGFDLDAPLGAAGVRVVGRYAGRSPGSRVRPRTASSISPASASTCAGGGGGGGGGGVWGGGGGVGGLRGEREREAESGGEEEMERAGDSEPERARAGQPRCRRVGASSAGRIRSEIGGGLQREARARVCRDRGGMWASAVGDRGGRPGARELAGAIAG